MAVSLAAQAQLSRSGTFFDPTQDWTWFLQIKKGATTPAGAFFRMFLVYGDPTSAASYIALRSPAASDDIVLKTFDGATTSTSTAFTPGASVWKWIAATYVASTHTLTFYGNSATPVGTLTVNLSTFTFSSKTNAIGSTVAVTSFGDYSVAYCRQWQVAMTGAQLASEALSTTVVQSGTLLANTPLQTTIDITDRHNFLQSWVATTAVVPTTDLGDPLLTTLAGPPANTAYTSAIAVTTDNAFFQDMISGGVPVQFGWYSVVAPAGATVLGAAIIGDSSRTYAPNTNIYDGVTDAAAGTPMVAISAADGCVQFPVMPGNTYYIKSTRNATPGTAVNQVSVIVAPNLPAAKGSYCVNDDSVTQGTITRRMPMAVISAIDGSVLRFVNDIAVGESGDSLPSGRYLYLLSNTNEDSSYYFYTADFTPLHVVPSGTFTGIIPIRSAASRDRWYAHVEAGTDQYVTAFLPDGTQTGLHITAGGGITISVTGLSVSPDNVTLYYANTLVGGGIHRWNIVSNTSVADLPNSAIVGYRVGNSHDRDAVLVNTDGSIVATYRKSSAPVDSKVRCYEPDGTLRWENTYSTDDPNRLTGLIDPTQFLLWTEPRSVTAIVDTFAAIKVADGTTAGSVTNPQYEGGAWEGNGNPPLAMGRDRFGHSESCPIFVLQAALSQTVPTTTYPIRRQRRWLLPSSPDNKVMQMPLLEILMRTGIGLLPDATGSTTPLGVDPQVLLRISKDGGKTWLPEQARSAGARGEYKDRVRFLRTPNTYRNAVAEVTVSDPVDWQMVSAMGTPTEGSS